LSPPDYNYNDEKKIRVCDHCYDSLKKNEINHSVLSHSLAKFTNIFDKNFTKMIDEAPYIPVVDVPQEKKFRANEVITPSGRDNEEKEESKQEIRTESFFESRRDKRKLSVTGESPFKINSSEAKKILLIFDKELIFSQDPIITTVENDLKFQTETISLFDCQNIAYSDKYKLVLIFINLWRHIPEEAEKLCQKIYQTYSKPTHIKSIFRLKFKVNIFDLRNK
jgi:hypothetical protein